jgi:hypothetical protein
MRYRGIKWRKLVKQTNTSTTTVSACIVSLVYICLIMSCLDLEDKHDGKTIFISKQNALE